MKKLYKSKNDRIISGVLGGLGEFYAVDPTLVRLGYIALVILTGIFPGIIAYIIASIIVPERPTHITEEKTETKTE